MKTFRPRRGEGFTLLKLVIVSFVIVILMVVSIVMVIDAGRRANEESALRSIRALMSANVAYRTRFGVYARSLADLSSADTTDAAVGAAGEVPGRSAYTFTYSVSEGFWDLHAEPVHPGFSGQRFFYADVSGVIRFADGAPAHSTSELVD